MVREEHDVGRSASPIQLFRRATPQQTEAKAFALDTLIEFSERTRPELRQRKNMAQSIKTERSLTTKDEFDILEQTHFPALLDLDEGALVAAQRRIRDLRSKERTLVREMRRGIRGKGQPRGSNFPGNVEKPSQRKQLFAGALKRINGEIARRQAIEAQTALKASAQRALALKKNAAKHKRPSGSRTSHQGMSPIESRKLRFRVNPAKIGRVSQATKVAQAAKDARN